MRPVVAAELIGRTQRKVIQTGADRVGNVRQCQIQVAVGADLNASGQHREIICNVLAGTVCRRSCWSKFYANKSISIVSDRLGVRGKKLKTGREARYARAIESGQYCRKIRRVGCDNGKWSAGK